MDNWNRNNQDEYTGVTAQRRNRRRMDPAGQKMPEEPVFTDEPDIDTEPVMPAGLTGFERPAATEPETPDEPETTDETKEPEKPEVSAEPEEPAEDEPAAEPVKPAEPETPAEQEKPAEPAAQGADSRVPPEARRMAAAPYGVPREGAKRPGTRPQVAQRRPPMPEQQRPAPRPRREAPAPETMRSGAARRREEPAPDATRGIAAQRERPARVNVGYAPGRMNEDATRQIPAADSVRESLYGREAGRESPYRRDGGREASYGRDARAYLEKRKQPFRMEEEKKPLQDRPGHKTLRIAVLLLVAAGIILSGLMLLKNRNGSNTPGSREVPQIISFDPPNTEGLIAPVELTFSVETDKTVDGIRLRGEGDRDLDTVVIFGDNADSKVWTMKMVVSTGFDGTVMLQVRRVGEEEWIDTGNTAQVTVSTPIGVEATATPTVNPEDDDYYDPDAEGTPAPEGQAGQTAAEPTAAPAEQATPTPTELSMDAQGEVTPVVMLTPEPTPTPAPTEEIATATPPLTAEAVPEANPDLITTTTVYTSFTKKEKEYSRPAKELIQMPAGDEYTKQKLGVMTFRGDNFRRNAATGTLSAAPVKLAVLWQTEAGSARGEKQTYYGYQWTGQPVIARWSTEVRTKSNITEAKIDKSALKEVIIAGVDGAIRFLDLEDGKITRNSIKLGYAMKGTPSLHPRGYPFMSVGQFARKMRNKRGQIGLRQYNLYSQKELKLIDGLDGKYHRPLNDIGSFETSALIDRVSDTLIAVGTNGALYLESLGSNFDYNTGVMTISPSTVVMTSRAKGQKSNALLAVESSPAAYDKYVFYADMGGVLRCVDTNTLKPVWAVETGDSVMAAIALDLTENRELNLYTANMFNNRKKGNGNVQIRRYDALTGREIWCTDVGVYKSKKDTTKDNVGAKASPVIGQNRLGGYVYFTVTGLSEEGIEQLKLGSDAPAALIALEKESGRVTWAFGLDSRSESSPIALYDKQGNGWIVQCEQNGTIHLLDGLTGTEINSLQIDGEIEASPAAYNNVVVVGTTGKGKCFVYGIEVRLDKQQSESSEPARESEKSEEPENNGENADSEAAADDAEADAAAEDEYENYDEYGDFEDYDEYADDEESGDGRQ